MRFHFSAIMNLVHILHGYLNWTSSVFDARSIALVVRKQLMNHFMCYSEAWIMFSKQNFYLGDSFSSQKIMFNLKLKFEEFSCCQAKLTRKPINEFCWNFDCSRIKGILIVLFVAPSIGKVSAWHFIGFLGYTVEGIFAIVNYFLIKCKTPYRNLF